MTIFAAVYPPPNKIEKLLTAINLEYKTFNNSIFEKQYNTTFFPKSPANISLTGYQKGISPKSKMFRRDKKLFFYSG